MTSDGTSARSGTAPRRFRKVLLLIVCTPVVGALLYCGAAVGLGLIPVNGDFQPSANGVDVYLVDNGVHVDFVVPARSKTVDWPELLPHDEFTAVNSSHRFIYFGWGERTFYIETPSWDDVKIKTIASAMLLPTAAAMHVHYTWRSPASSATVKKVRLSDTQYGKLTDLILKSFRRTPDGHFQRIVGKNYGETDNFYEAVGSYHAFNTCNLWTNRVLKVAQ